MTSLKENSSHEKLPPLIESGTPSTKHKSVKINKSCKEVSVKKMCRSFSAPPEEQSLTVSFSVYPNNLCHTDVLKLVQDRLNHLPSEDSIVQSIQCELRNVICGTFGIPDRWIIRVTSRLAIRELLRGLRHGKKVYLVRKHTDVLMEEYKMFLRLQKVSDDMKVIRRRDSDVTQLLARA